jgi:uncharacterized membrane protein
VVARVTKRRLAFAFLCMVVIIGGVLVWALPKPPLYRVTILPALSPSLGGQFTRARALNDAGQVAGVACTGILGGGHLFLWDRKSGLQDLGLVGNIAALDNDGRICGIVPADPNHEQAFLWEPDKGLILLGTLGYARSRALAMNSRGQVVGACETTTGRIVVNKTGCTFLWDKAGGTRELKTDIKDPWSASINDTGQILLKSSSRWLLLDPNGSTTALDGVSGTWEPQSVSSNGCVVGIDAANHRLAFLQRRGEPRYLSSGSDGLSHVTRLNDKGQIAFTVGFGQSWWQKMVACVRGSNGTSNGDASCVWDPVRGRVWLDRYVRDMKEFWVEDLNNSGAIVGTARMGDDTWRAVLLEPIPEQWRR